MNVVTADKISNSVVKVKKTKGFDETILKTVRTKLGLPQPNLARERALNNPTPSMFAHARW